jgi:hypothetical protein
VHQVGNQPRLYYNAQSTNHQKKKKKVIHKFTGIVQSYEDLFIDTVSVMYINKGL